MSWTCAGCGQESNHIRAHIEEGKMVEQCDSPDCGNLSSIDASVPDVFWNGRPYYSEALGVEFTSRSQKARILKERGVSELGNTKLPEKSWIEGSREWRRKNFDKDRPMIREVLRRYRENAGRK